MIRTFNRVIAMLLLGFLAGCAGVPLGRVSLGADPTCKAAMTNAMASILVEQGEPKDEAMLVARNSLPGVLEDFGRDGFGAHTSYPANYRFLVEFTTPVCQLHLFSRARDDVKIEFRGPFLATRPLTNCECMPVK